MSRVQTFRREEVTYPIWMAACQPKQLNLLTVKTASSNRVSQKPSTLIKLMSQLNQEEIKRLNEVRIQPSRQVYLVCRLSVVVVQHPGVEALVAYLEVLAKIINFFRAISNQYQRKLMKSKKQ